jgi:hypothetical protein
MPDLIGGGHALAVLAGSLLQALVAGQRGHAARLPLSIHQAKNFLLVVWRKDRSPGLGGYGPTDDPPTADNRRLRKQLRKHGLRKHGGNQQRQRQKSPDRCR